MTSASLVLMALAIRVLASCERAPVPAPAGPAQVVLYSSVDEVVARPIIDRFERETGISVVVQGDTEATKTTGLVQRLRAEKGAPRADVFWSSEVFLTIALAKEGLLAPLEAPSVAGWPEAWRDEQRRWHGFGLRARVLVYNTSSVSAEEAPRSMHNLIDTDRWMGRIVMARPAFGTTRGHMAALVTLWGEDGVKSFLEALKYRGVRLVDGNSAVVRAVAMGEADIGLTDTDDVWSGQREGWPVGLVYVRHDVPAREGQAELVAGPLVIPNTVSVVAGGPNPDNGRRLAEFLLSEPVERALAESDSHNVAIRPELAKEFSKYAVPDPAKVSYEQIASSMDAAMTLCREVLGP